VRVRLRELRRDAAIVTLGGAAVPAGSRSVRYRTRTGALLRIDGVVRGAFDAKHETFDLATDARGPIEVDVELRSLPQSGLPSGDGRRWRRLLAEASEPPDFDIVFSSRVVSQSASPVRESATLALVGHSHLDVAWLWDYDEAIRKATRTFATAVRQLEATPTLVFTQTTPQLYADVARAEPELFARMQTLARAGGLDTSGAALWVEADCNLPSGESLLRQMMFGSRYIEEHFGAAPTVAWLPDSFGFPNTLPTLLRHAGIGAFGTTKLTWNDTNAFAHARFAWEGPDGSRVLAANVASIEGAFAPARVRRASERRDLVLVGYGDGGGGMPDETIAEAPRYGTFTTLGRWFETLGAGALPVVRDELYLETHRGTLTTHRDVKSRNARLERELGNAELALAWAVVLRATPFFVTEARAQLARAWQLTLRAQFHDVLPGSAIGEVYERAHRDYDEAEALVAAVAHNARGVLPAMRAPVALPDVAPHEERGGWRLRSDRMSALIGPAGTIVELFVNGRRNLVRAGARLAAYVDKPKVWDAWNVDRGYDNRRVRMRVTSVVAEDDAVVVGYAFGESQAVVRFSLAQDADALAIEIGVAWNESHRLLRLENTFAFAAHEARFGSPHGTIARPPRPRSRVERAKFEAPGQRFACVRGDRGGVALLTRDTYGWSLATKRVTTLGNSLLRAPLWPDPQSDRGQHVFVFALRPFVSLTTGELEAAWAEFADGSQGSAPMFVCDDRAILIVATKPADDGDGIIVRARECDGAVRSVAIRCAVRARDVVCVDARERPLSGDVRFEDEAFTARFRPHELRSFRVRVG
jgi:alpha-mannosidase